jgi:predicted alpha-1,2-mannosidase
MATTFPEKDPLHWVDPFIGVDSGGNTFPGACLPFSMVRLSPDTLPPQSTAGYVSRAPILGFSHTHTSGTGGGGRYGNFLVTPQTGPIRLKDLAAAKADEVAEPGYYAVTLAGSGVRAEMTCTSRCGMHRYTFPVDQTARLLLKVTATRNTRSRGDARVMASEARIVSDRRIEGFVTTKGGWGNTTPYTTWFVAEFDRPFTASGIWRDENIVPGGKETGGTEGTEAGVYAEFRVRAKEPIGLRVGISFSRLENARKHLAQTERQNFDSVRRKAQDEWRRYLSKIRIDGGTAEQRTLFYTGLYHSVVMPTDITGDNPRWESDEPHFWDFYTLWDTVRCTNSLYTLIYPERQSEIVRCFLDIYRHRGWLPDAWIAGDFGNIQGGTNADTVIADSIVKGIGGFDREVAYRAVRKDATSLLGDGYKFGRFPEYRTRGWLPFGTPAPGQKPNNLSSSRTLEYAANDFSVAQIARSVGQNDDAERFTRQSQNAFHLFNPETKFFWAKDASGRWIDGFDAAKRMDSGSGPFYEGSAWHYATYVPHDMEGLIQRHGGARNFEAFLDRLFDTDQYLAGNEPDLLTPWLYTYVNRPAKNGDRVRAILARFYHAARNGLPGNDDVGAMSSWYIFGAMGFYPNVGQDVYLIGSPLFPKTVMELGNGKTFTLRAKGVSEQNRYIQSATLNGKPWNKGWFQHRDIAPGAILHLEMGPKPSDWGTAGPPPPSVTAR